MRKPASQTVELRAQRRAGTEAPPRRRGDPTLYVALVQTPREICFVTAADSRGALERRLALYVREHARQQLWPDDADRVEALLAAGETAAAIWLYFDSTGTRWDEERLRIEVVNPVTDAGEKGAMSGGPPGGRA